MVHVRSPGGIKSLVSSYGGCLSVLASNYSTIEQQDAAIISTCTEWCFIIFFTYSKTYLNFLDWTNSLSSLLKLSQELIPVLQFTPSQIELYHFLIKMFVDTDTNKDDLANRGFFSKFIDMAAFIPGMYGYAPTDVELYETEDEKEQARRKMFNSMGPGVMTLPR